MSFARTHALHVNIRRCQLQSVDVLRTANRSIRFLKSRSAYNRYSCTISSCLFTAYYTNEREPMHETDFHVYTERNDGSELFMKLDIQLQN